MIKILTFEVFKRDPLTRRVSEQLGKARGRAELRALLQKHGGDLIEGTGPIKYWQIKPPFDAIVVNMENIDDGKEEWVTQ